MGVFRSTTSPRRESDAEETHPWPADSNGVCGVGSVCVWAAGGSAKHVCGVWAGVARSDSAVGPGARRQRRARPADLDAAVVLAMLALQLDTDPRAGCEPAERTWHRMSGCHQHSGVTITAQHTDPTRGGANLVAPTNRTIPSWS